MSITSEIDRLYEDLTPGTRVQVPDGRQGTIARGQGTVAHDPRRQVLVKIGGRVKPFRKNDVKLSESKLASIDSKQESKYTMNEDKSVEGQDLVKQASEDLHSPEKLEPTAGRVYWKDVKKSDKVIKLGSTFYVQAKDDCRYNIYWNGQEAVEATTHLGTLVKNPALKEDEANDPLPDSSDEEGGESKGVTDTEDLGVTEGLPSPSLKEDASLGTTPENKWTVARLKTAGYQGPDASLDTSLFEYGMAWKFDEQGDKDWKFIYRIRGNEGAKVQYFDFGWFPADLNPRKEFNWIDDAEWASMAETYGTTVEELLAMPVPQLVYELTNTHGYENIFGSTYHEGIAIADPFYAEDEPETSEIKEDADDVHPTPPLNISYSISPGRSKLILHADDKTRAELAELKKQREFESDRYASFMVEDETSALEPVIANSEIEYVRPEEMGDLTDAPILGIRGEDGKVLERWGYMSYQVKSFLDDLMDKGEAVFVSGGDENTAEPEVPTGGVRESLKNPDFLPDPGPGMSPKYEEIMPEAPTGNGIELAEYKLPAYWASYLINGDASGLKPGEEETIDAWLEKEGNPSMVDCGEQYFSWRNDATNLGGDVCDYTAHVRRQAPTPSKTAHIPPMNTGGSSHKSIGPLSHRPVKEDVEDLPDFEPDLGDEHLEGQAEADEEVKEEDSLADIWREDRIGEYIQINPDGSAVYVAHGKAMEKIYSPTEDGDVFAAIREWSNKNQLFYNTWGISDHGNVELYDQHGKSYGGLV